MYNYFYFYVAASAPVEQLAPLESAQINAEDVQRFEAIGRGGMATVYKGSYRKRDVAIKECVLATRRTADVADNLMQNEARIHITVAHDNIVRFYGFYYMDTALHIVTELMEKSVEGILYPKNGEQNPHVFTDTEKMFVSQEFTQ